MKTIIITAPFSIKDEAVICNTLFAHGLELLHLRKPDADESVYENFIRQIAPSYRNRIVLHGHYNLAYKYQLHGIHLHAGTKQEYSDYVGLSISISCHSIEEIRQLPFEPAYCFLSPVFDSISKKGYLSAFPGLPDLSQVTVPVVALGGITPDKIDLCRRAGFSGVAALGYIWEKAEEALSRFIRLKTPFVMSIAGFDPSGGAGVNADLKTFEATGSYGLGICSAITFQNEDSYTGTRWISLPEIQKQCELQFQKHYPEFVKIGLIENFEILDQLTAWLKEKCPAIKIIWDPILKASAGYVFHKDHISSLPKILQRIYLVTPNAPELHQLFENFGNIDDLQEIAGKYQVNILWKGGHHTGQDSTDHLITPTTIVPFTVQRSIYSKHGSGCVLSAAITSALAQGFFLSEACNKAQVYISSFINSNDSKLGFHSLQSATFDSKPHIRELNLQYITAPKRGVSLGEQVESICRGGARWVQLRMKGASIAEILSEGQLIKEICRRYHALFIINDNVHAARQLDADGVHLGKEDMDPLQARRILGNHKIIGATCNTWDDILLRRSQQVDYIGLGPFTFTTTKEKLSPTLGLEGYSRLLSQMREKQIHIPVFAIGGITENDLLPLMQTGIQGIALSGLIKNSNDLGDKTREILKQLNN